MQQARSGEGALRSLPATGGGFEIRRGLDPAAREAAAQLYWSAFAGKLGRVLGPEPRALDYLARVIRPDHCLCALDCQGRLIGLAGFRSHLGGFASGGFDDMCPVYGRAGALWRACAFALLSREVENARFLVDGLCVLPGMRGQGVGLALIGAIVAELPTGAVAGLGARLLAGSYYGQTVQIWSALFMAAALAAVLVAVVGIGHRMVLKRMGMA